MRSTRRIFFALLTMFMLVTFNVRGAHAADVITWKMPTAYPAGSFLWEYIAVNFADKVKTLSNGRLIITPITAGAICPALKYQMQSGTGLQKRVIPGRGTTWAEI